MKMTPGMKIKELRLLAGLSQEELGKRVGLQRAAINKYETGSVTNIPIRTIEKLATVFDVSPSYILSWDGAVEDALAIEVKVIQGVKYFFGEPAVDLIETYTLLNSIGRKRLLQFADDLSKLYAKE